MVKLLQKPSKKVKMVVRRDPNALKLLQDSGIVPPGSPTRLTDRIAHSCADAHPTVDQGRDRQNFDKNQLEISQVIVFV